MAVLKALPEGGKLKQENNYLSFIDTNVINSNVEKMHVDHLILKYLTLFFFLSIIIEYCATNWLVESIFFLFFTKTYIAKCRPFVLATIGFSGAEKYPVLICGMNKSLSSVGKCLRCLVWHWRPLNNHSVPFYLCILTKMFCFCRASYMICFAYS